MDIVMKFTKIMFTLSTFCLLSIVSTSTVTATTSSQDVAPKQKATTKYMPESTQSFEHIVELLPEDFKPAFTRETVITLNAIVKRSYAVIEEFDDLNQELEKTMHKPSFQRSAEQLKALVQHKLTVRNNLRQRSKTALSDMQQAVKTLKASDEHYNAAVLAGMFTFVKTVEREVSGLL
jgi:hypothetical protein